MLSDERIIEISQDHIDIVDGIGLDGDLIDFARAVLKAAVDECEEFRLTMAAHVISVD